MANECRHGVSGVKVADVRSGVINSVQLADESSSGESMEAVNGAPNPTQKPLSLGSPVVPCSLYKST